MSLDCQACGACCCNSDQNRAEGYLGYVAIEDRDSALLSDARLRARLVQDLPGEGPHLKLTPTGRCVALEGPLGKRVRCGVYALRPAGCRRVTAGDEACLRARRERGIVERGRR